MVRIQEKQELKYRRHEREGDSIGIKVQMLPRFSPNPERGCPENGDDDSSSRLDQ